MGLRGPAPTPTELLARRGSSLVTKRRREREVKGPEGAPEPPDWLEKPARGLWDYLIPLLTVMGVLTRIDREALARYCAMWSRWREAEEFIAKHGLMYPLKDEAGQPKCFQAWPQVAIANKLAQQLTRLEHEFGMTPSGRARLTIKPPIQRSPSSDIMRLVRVS